MNSVLDASALLAFVLNEPGADRVREVLRAGAASSAVNWAEALSRLVDLGADAAAEVQRLHVLFAEDLTIVAMDDVQAEEVARLRLLTRHLGLSLGDRACLALAAALGVPVLTADRAWTQLEIGVGIESVR